MIINLRPLIYNRDYRWLFLGQAVSFLGSMITYVAVPYQIYQLTNSSFLVGLLGSVQLVPLLVTGLYGGALADSMDRRKLLIGSEIMLTVLIFGLFLNSRLEHPNLIAIFALSALASSVIGFHRPAMEALTPQIVAKEDLPAIAALGSLRYSLGAIAGPALGGFLIARFGASIAFAIDFMSFGFSLFALLMMKNIPKVTQATKAGLSSILEGLRYASKRPDLVGTYLVDIIAMLFAMPMALFPAMAQSWGGAPAAGWLYLAMPLGSIFISLFSGYAGKIHRHGAAVILAATTWGLAITALAFAPSLGLAVFCLALAGAADGISGLYRQTIWNSTIPSHFRGRLAGVEMLSYMSGPLLGNARAGFLASTYSNFVSILSGGIFCVVACLACIWIFPKFWKYRDDQVQNN